MLVIGLVCVQDALRQNAVAFDVSFTGVGSAEMSGKSCCPDSCG